MSWTLRRTVILVMIVCIIGVSVPTCAAESHPCIILAVPNEVYVLSFNSIDIDTVFEISVTYDRFREVASHLAVQGAFDVIQDTWSANTYYILSSDDILCTVQFKGIENVFLGEERARLEISSSDYFIHLKHIQMDEPIENHDLSSSFQLVIALCSLIPFFLLTPDTIEELQEILELDMQTRGVYGKVLILLLPLLSIALTILLLESLTVLVI